MKSYRVWAYLTVMAMVLNVLCSLGVPIHAIDNTPTVKVGYFHMEGYNELNEDGLYSGYDYDFFQLLERYTNLNFEYVGYDKTWQEMQEMLSNGEIDVLTSMHITDERLEKYDFTYDIGSSYTMLTIKMGNNKLQSGNYASYDGMVVGMLKQSSQNDVFKQFAEENGFTYSVVYFDSTTELSQAVQDGTVDSAVTSSLRQLSGERVIEEINHDQFYAVVAKGNTELLDEINQGITQMDIYDGDWRNTLYYRYYGYKNPSEDEVTYSNRELSVLDEYSNGGKTLTVCFDPALAPYSYISDGEMVGILPDAIAEVLDSIGIDYEYIIPKDHMEYLQMYQNAEADVFPETIADSDSLVQQTYLYTDSYFTARLGMLTERSGHTTMNTIAVLEDDTFYKDLKLSQNQVVKYYTSTDDVVNAVINGEADVAYLMNYTAQMYLNREKLSELAYLSQPDIHYDMSIAINRQTPHEICSILNKNITTFDSLDLYALSLNYIESSSADVTFTEYLQLHPKTAVLLFTIVLVMVVVILILCFITNRKAERERQQRDLQNAYAETESALADAQQYRHAVLAEAFVAYDANITKNSLDEDVYEEYGDVKRGLMEHLGLKRPYSYDEYINKVTEIMTEPEDAKIFREKTDREYLLNLVAQGKTEDVFEYRTKLIDGELVDVRHTTYLTKHHKTNDIIAHINDKNITSQKKNERQMRKYEQILITTATDTYKGVRRVNLETQQAEYIRFNDGQIIETQIGKWTDWITNQKKNVHPDDFNKVLKFFSMENLLSLKVGVPCRLDYRSSTKNNENIYRVYTTTASIILVDGKKVAIMTTLDTTSAVESEMEQKRIIEEALRSAEEANRAKTVFLSNMSHDIRTPMNAIIGFTTLAQTHLDDIDQVKDYLDKISSSSIHLLSLINDVLDMSRIESGRLHIEEKECDLLELIHSVEEIILPDLQAKGLNFTMDTSQLNDNYAICDSLRLNRVLLNLLGNAIKFTESGGDVKLTVLETSNDGQGIGIFEFHVIDNGIGMSEEFIGKVFEPFERERNSTVSGVQGTGLGMSISKNIVDMMGGTIEVDSIKGKGTEFTVTIPMKVVNHKKSTIETPSKNTSVVDFHGKRVLLVEDNDLNREIAMEILSAVGLIVEEAEDGNVAIEKLLERGADYYSVVLMDIQMPTMDGYTATKNIRAFEDSKLANIPIVAMTANAFEEDRQKAISAGMNAHIAKPISIEVLFETLKKVLG